MECHSRVFNAAQLEGKSSEPNLHGFGFKNVNFPGCVYFPIRILAKSGGMSSCHLFDEALEMFEGLVFP